MMAQRYALQNRLQLILGGELDGKPVPGGIIGNSPIDAFAHDINGAVLHFESTNFGRLLARIWEFSRSQPDRCDIYVMSYANVAATAKAVSAGGYERIVLGAAGFFECVALEDQVLGGYLLTTMNFAAHEHDDEALAMVGVYRAYSIDETILSESWTARVLRELSKEEDISDALVGRRFPSGSMERMADIVLKVSSWEGRH
jgi:phosphosulfolactate phosphohydrolase-like enzyme